ncbi:fasciclin domain-containing protein [Chitinophaga niastensis]|uniref:Fasciclin domain-containing protein n=1 Tax=Chitinophaga niastensis TaxID=536980 RepID=A0A2P8HDS7_CHINA|nr:fasciclin domain-containing protein [Chitinophaga niastensis]PSL44385.1 fasciclin domain-containing protein [Chitinophaga niastensis]
MKTGTRLFPLLVVVLMVLTLSCKKDNYYKDSGKQVGVYDIGAYDFLKARPLFFDTLINIIDSAGLQDVLQKETVTFFAPTNHAIKKTMDVLNSARYMQNKDSVYIRDIPGDIWKRFLSHYIFRGRYMLKDIARRDKLQLPVFPGQNMESYNGYIMNLGVQFSDYSKTKDVGPRTVVITAIGDLANPAGITNLVATSDLQCKNEVVHVLDDDHFFGFDAFAFTQAVQDYLQQSGRH